MHLVLPWNTTTQAHSSSFLCTQDETPHIWVFISWCAPATRREHCDTIHHSVWFCPSPHGPQMSWNLSTFAVKGLFQGTDVCVQWLTECKRKLHSSSKNGELLLSQANLKAHVYFKRSAWVWIQQLQHLLRSLEWKEKEPGPTRTNSWRKRTLCRKK